LAFGCDIMLIRKLVFAFVVFFYSFLLNSAPSLIEGYNIKDAICDMKDKKEV